jgi:hypothetical protein
MAKPQGSVRISANGPKSADERMPAFFTLPECNVQQGLVVPSIKL